jgi:hypothetical protein
MFWYDGAIPTLVEYTEVYVVVVKGDINCFIFKDVRFDCVKMSIEYGFSHNKWEKWSVNKVKYSRRRTSDHIYNYDDENDRHKNLNPKQWNHIKKSLHHRQAGYILEFIDL